MSVKIVIASLLISLLLGTGLLFARRNGVCSEPDAVKYTASVDRTVWGSVSAGLSLSIDTSKESYRLGEAIALDSAIRNVSNEDLRVLSPGNIPYRIALYDEKGKPVEMTQLSRSNEIKFFNDDFDYFDPYRSLPVGQIISDKPIDLTKLFIISKAGNYRVVVMRRIDPKLSRGFLVSNMAVVNIK